VFEQSDNFIERIKNFKLYKRFIAYILGMLLLIFPAYWNNNRFNKQTLIKIWTIKRNGFVLLHLHWA
jgi:hypothetical protein